MIENIAIVIPALNEEDALRHLLPEIPQMYAQWLIVVDNGSTDETASVAQSAGAVVVKEAQRGYGRACLSGFKKACELGAELVIFMDGDGSDDPAGPEFDAETNLGRTGGFCDRFACEQKRRSGRGAAAGAAGELAGERPEFVCALARAYMISGHSARSLALY